MVEHWQARRIVVEFKGEWKCAEQGTQSEQRIAEMVDTLRHLPRFRPHMLHPCSPALRPRSILAHSPSGFAHCAPFLLFHIPSSLASPCSVLAHALRASSLHSGLRSLTHRALCSLTRTPSLLPVFRPLAPYSYSSSRPPPCSVLTHWRSFFTHPH